MSDIEQRYQLCKVCGAKDCDCTLTDALSKIESLRQQLAEKDAEIELERTARQQIEKLLHRQAETIAASQLREQQLLEALNDPVLYCSEAACTTDDVFCCRSKQKQALALPTDTSALDKLKAEVAAKAGEVMRQRAVLPFIQDHCEYFGREITDAICALPGVTLEDLKNG